MTLTDEQRSKLDKAQDILQYRFANEHFLLAAVTHPSAVEGRAIKYSYERLEFLGDSILGAIVATEAFERFHDLDEGGLTRIKVALVAGSTLADVAGELGFADIIVFGSSEAGTGKRGLHSALENVYEALVAALYLDGGIEAARAWIVRTLGPYVSKDIAAEPESPKSSLQEYLQARQKKPEYQITGYDGPPHDRIFYARVTVEGEVRGEGKGRSKKEAEAHAAQRALEGYGQN